MLRFAQNRSQQLHRGANACDVQSKYRACPESWLSIPHLKLNLDIWTVLKKVANLLRLLHLKQLEQEFEKKTFEGVHMFSSLIHVSRLYVENMFFFHSVVSKLLVSENPVFDYRKKLSGFN